MVGHLRIDLNGIRFRYPSVTPFDSANSFTLGPINLSMSSGEIVFIAGENGCGKTTLMKLLIGLNKPMVGSIHVNGVTVTDDLCEDFRQLFSVVFADFHLFEKLLGVDVASLDGQAFRYLHALQLASHVTLADGTICNSGLSNGQRQRVALFHACLEDRPIYVFDELAANQDANFRERFYRQLLPELRQRGKLVIVISHDERYFDVADRVLYMTSGFLESGDQSIAA
ncbi:MAG: ATP-binding cassette domain-containing protein [Planctomycetes bacterium]|nr:ATP-binding cassette domain-containing protein [Planctomycetota bacterium]